MYSSNSDFAIYLLFCQESRFDDFLENNVSVNSIIYFGDIYKVYYEILVEDNFPID